MFCPCVFFCCRLINYNLILQLRLRSIEIRSGKKKGGGRPPKPPMSVMSFVPEEIKVSFYRDVFTGMPQGRTLAILHRTCALPHELLEETPLSIVDAITEAKMSKQAGKAMKNFLKLVGCDTVEDAQTKYGTANAGWKRIRSISADYAGKVPKAGSIGMVQHVAVCRSYLTQSLQASESLSNSDEV